MIGAKKQLKKYLTILFVLFFIGVQQQLSAQKAKSDISEVFIPGYNFMDSKYKSIQIPGQDSTRLNNFFQKVDALVNQKSGRINILHIGGSHVQADMFSHQVRQNLDAINEEFQTPRGFIFPFTVAKTNNPTNYKVTYSGEWSAARNVQKNRQIPVGVGGIAVYTSDPKAKINVSLNPDDILRWDFDQLRLLGYVEDGSDMVTPVLYYNNDTIEGHLDLISNTYLFNLPEPNYSFSIGFIQKDAVPRTFILNGFIPEKETPGIVYHAIGVNGASVPSYLGSEYFEDELHLLNPDLVIFGIGINDATSKDFTDEWFRQNYDDLIDVIERVSPDCAYIFVTNNDSFKRVSKKSYQVNHNGVIAKNAFYKLAEKHQGGVWDLFSLMGGLTSMRKWQTERLAQPDKVHFTRAGYLLIGDMFYNAFIDYYKQIDSE